MKNNKVVSTSELIAARQFLNEAIAIQYAKRAMGIGYDQNLTALFESSANTIESLSRNNKANQRKRSK